MFSSKRERSGAELLPSSGEAFAERLDMLASTVSATAAALAKTDGELATLRRALENGLAQVEALVAEARSRAGGGDLRALEKRVSELAAERSKSADANRLDDLSRKVALLAERVDTLATTVATTAASVAGRDGEVAAMRRLYEGSHAPAVDETLLRRVEDVAAASASASMRLESHGGQIGALASRVEDVDEQISELVQRVDSADRERVALAASVADAAAIRWREFERALDTLVARLDAVEERGATASSELSRAISLWPAALRSLESRVEELASASPGSEPAAAAPGDADRPQVADTSILVALRTLERRMQSADDAAHEERETAARAARPARGAARREARAASRRGRGRPLPLGSVGATHGDAARGPAPSPPHRSTVLARPHPPRVRDARRPGRVEAHDRAPAGLLALVDEVRHQDRVHVLAVTNVVAPP